MQDHKNVQLKPKLFVQNQQVMYSQLNNIFHILSFKFYLKIFEKKNEVLQNLGHLDNPINCKDSQQSFLNKDSNIPLKNN